MDETIYEPGVTSAAAASPGNDDQRRLKSFLAARNDEPEVREVHIASIDDTVVIRELTERELTDWQTMYVDESPRTRKRSIVEQSAALIAAALVSPKPSEGELSDAGFTSLTDMVRQSLKPVEVMKLAEMVMEISGGAEDAVEVAGN
jgi:hypothetical protein